MQGRRHAFGRTSETRLSRNAKAGLKLTAKLLGMSREDLRARVEEAVDDPDHIDVAEDKPRRYKALSGGGYVRVVVAPDDERFVISIHERSKLG